MFRVRKKRQQLYQVTQQLYLYPKIFFSVYQYYFMTDHGALFFWFIGIVKQPIRPPCELHAHLPDISNTEETCMKQLLVQPFRPQQ